MTFFPLDSLSPEPIPSCPLLLSPAAHRDMSLFMTRLWFSPAAMVSTLTPEFAAEAVTGIMATICAAQSDTAMIFDLLFIRTPSI